MKMPRDLVAFRRRIVAVSAVLIALCTVVCMTLFAVPLVRADMAARRHMLEELSNQPFDIERAASGIEAGRTSGLVVTGPDISWCRVAVGESGEVVAVERGGAAVVDSLSEGGATQLVRLHDEDGSEPFTFDGRNWIGLWQPLGAQDGAVTVSNGSVTSVEAAPTEVRVYTFLDVTPHGEFVVSLALRCVAYGAVIVLCATVVAAFATTRALRPVMEARERERGFVLSASHELKTPLMAITSACDVLEAEAAIPDAVRDSLSLGVEAGGTGSSSRWIGVIREASDEMARSISDMLRSLDGGV
ncbi:histidine kinase dimerization/phospho-acceptor domain-containing protein [Collinsella sp. D33t1_170424_A12]|uniref:histidine kinase dimerization/phospho-acceptor domain-containing protein n=1 Tax=Collinsella sp. D33t1_170424_A12 TaxID=2787135 RepID=UPI00189B72B5|nr:histidine kinase dimerization/phospho-acceptor domain-containing protein [Collinsella sp. D33t1_170424_A12]